MSLKRVDASFSFAVLHIKRLSNFFEIFLYLFFLMDKKILYLYLINSMVILNCKECLSLSYDLTI